jgi:hypothetical protein
MPKEQWVIKSLTPRKIILIINRDTGIKLPLFTIEFILEPIDAEYIVYTRWDYNAKTLHYKTKFRGRKVSNMEFTLVLLSLKKGKRQHRFTSSEAMTISTVRKRLSVSPFKYSVNLQILRH